MADGGRSPASGAASNFRYFLTKPYEMTWPPSAEQWAQLDQMLIELYDAGRILLTALEEGNVIDEDTGEASTGGTASAWTFVHKTEDETRNNTNANDADLQFEMAANKTYLVRVRLYFFNGAAANAPRWTPTGPASPAVISPVRASIGAANWAVPLIGAVYPAEQTVTVGASVNGFVWGEFLIQNGTTSGDFIIQWRSASSTAGNEVILRKGSYLEYTAITG